MISTSRHYRRLAEGDYPALQLGVHFSDSTEHTVTSLEFWDANGDHSAIKLAPTDVEALLGILTEAHAAQGTAGNPVGFRIPV